MDRNGQWKFDNYVEWHTLFTFIGDDMYQFPSNHMSQFMLAEMGMSLDLKYYIFIFVFGWMDVFPFLFL